MVVAVAHSDAGLAKGVDDAVEEDGWEGHWSASAPEQDNRPFERRMSGAPTATGDVITDLQLGTSPLMPAPASSDSHAVDAVAPGSQFETRSTAASLRTLAASESASPSSGPSPTFPLHPSDSAIVLLPDDPLPPAVENDDDVPASVGPSELFTILDGRYLHTLTIDCTSSARSASGIPGARRIVYFQRMRRKMERSHVKAVRKERRKGRQEMEGRSAAGAEAGASTSEATEDPGITDRTLGGLGGARASPTPHADITDVDGGEPELVESVIVPSTPSDRDTLADLERDIGVGNDFARVEAPPQPPAPPPYHSDSSSESEDDDDDLSLDLDSDADDEQGGMSSSFPRGYDFGEGDDEDNFDLDDDDLDLDVGNLDNLGLGHWSFPLDSDGDALMRGANPPSPPALLSKHAQRRRRRRRLAGIDFRRLSELQAWDLNKVSDVMFLRRIDGDVILYDERGHPSGFAASLVKVLNYLTRGGMAASPTQGRIRYLSGGLRAFRALYPDLTDPAPVHALDLPDRSDPMERDDETMADDDMISSPADRAPAPVAGHFPHLPVTSSPVHDLREIQAHLISSVWYGKTSPCGDLPLPILPGFLYLSSCFATTPQHLHPLGITHVLRLGWGFEDHCRDQGVSYYDFPIEDSPMVLIGRLFEKVVGILEDARAAGERVLVHCHAGVSRSSTVVLAYMVKVGGMTLREAWEIAYKVRPIIRPNDGFAKALQELELACHPHLTEPTLPICWMSESYAYYMDYLEYLERLDRHRERVRVEMGRKLVVSDGEAGNVGSVVKEVGTSDEEGSVLTLVSREE